MSYPFEIFLLLIVTSISILLIFCKSFIKNIANSAKKNNFMISTALQAVGQGILGGKFFLASVAFKEAFIKDNMGYLLGTIILLFSALSISIQHETRKENHKNEGLEFSFTTIVCILLVILPIVFNINIFIYTLFNLNLLSYIPY